MSDGVIGREPELGSLMSWLEGVPSGGTALLIEGEAGIGKTTVLQAGLAEARGRCRVLFARPSQAEERLSFTGLGDLLDPVADQMIDVLPEPQRDALEVALLRRTTDGRPPDPRTVGAATLSSLRALAEEGPVVVAVDDVQWADKATAGALAFAFRRLDREPIGALLARRGRPGGVLPLDLEGATVGTRLKRVAVEGLSPGAIRTLVETRLDWSPTRSTLKRIHEVSSGNPLFALELARALKDRDEEASPGEPLPVPERLRDLVLRRLRQLAPDHRDVLLHAAAMAQPTVVALEAAAGPITVEALDSAEELGITRRDRERVAFVHPLFASVMYASTRASRRRVVHERLAAIASATEERARHLALARTKPDDHVAAVLEEASNRARARGAPDAAAEFAELSRLSTPEDDVDGIVRRELLAADHHMDAGNVDDAHAALDRVMAGATDTPVRAGALRRRARLELRARGPDAAVPLLEEALRVIGDGHTHEHALILSLLSFCGLTGGRSSPQISIERAAHAVEIAREVGDRPTEVLSVLYLLQAKLLAGDGVDAELLDKTPDLMTGAPTLWFRGALLVFSKQLSAGRAWLEKFRRHAEDVGDERDLVMALGLLCEAEGLAGNFERARALAEHAIEVMVAGGQTATVPMAAGVLAASHAVTGRFVEARRIVDHWLPVAEASLFSPALFRMRWGLGLTELSAGDPKAVVAALDPLWQMSHRIFDPMPFLGDYIEALVQIGDLDHVREAIDHTAALARRSRDLYLDLAARRGEASLAAARGDLEAAMRSADAAIARLEGFPMPFEAARTWLLHGSLMRRAKRKRTARASLQRAIEMFRAHGALAWERRALDELDRLGLRPARSLELTPTEERIAKLVADGKSNKEIAAALSITLRTVESNLTRVYRKLGVERRTELVRSLLGAR